VGGIDISYEFRISAQLLKCSVQIQIFSNHQVGRPGGKVGRNLEVLVCRLWVIDATRRREIYSLVIGSDEP
jgi:hypothetical protein